MRYSSFFIPKEKTLKLGIEKIEIGRLSNVIAFIGKNGSGKTRILDLIEKYPFSSNVKIDIIPNELTEDLKYYELLKKYNDLLNQSVRNGNWTIEINKINNQIDRLYRNRNKESNENSITDIIKQKYICRIKHEEISILEIILKENPNPNIFIKLIENNEKGKDILTTNNAISSIKKGSLNYLKNLSHNLVADKIKCKINDDDLNNKDSFKRFSSLKKYINIFLNKELDWSSKESDGKYLDPAQEGGGYNITYKGYFTLNKRVFKHEELSPGEKILFSYAILFFLLEQNKQINISESIILIDEPELHLHADSEIDLITKLREIISEKGQLIIATHSINILSTLNYEDIFVVKDGNIENPSRNSLTNSLHELIGIEEKINRLSDLLISIESYSYNNFIKQCLSEQEAIKVLKENDSQLEIIKNIIREKINNPNTNFLDFGAGRGRLLEGLLNNQNLPKLKYNALEPNNNYHIDIKNLGITNIFNDYSELPDNSFDFIILVNVLHEIKITSWETTLNKIIDSLIDDGIILIVEQKILAKGEMINDAGFIVLDDKGIKTLFNLPNEIKSFYIDDYQDKTNSVIIQKKEINKVDTNSITKALTVVQNNSLKNIEVLRGQKNSNSNEYDRGRKMAFYTMQYVNAKIGIDLLNK